MRALAVLLVTCGPVAANVEVAHETFDACLGLGDAIFEQSVLGITGAIDAARLVSLYSTAPADCSATAVGLCVVTEPHEFCVRTVNSWIETHRGEIAERLPSDIQHDTPFTERHYERQRVSAGVAPCEDTPEACFVSEVLALDAAYQAWRMARRAGVMPLVGHEPVDMETLQ